MPSVWDGNVAALERMDLGGVETSRKAAGGQGRTWEEKKEDIV